MILRLAFALASQFRIPRHQLGVTKNGVHRGTYFVGHGRQKHTLSPAGSLSLGRCDFKPPVKLLPFRDVAHGGNNQGSLFGLQWAQADLNGKLATVLSQPVEFCTSPHGPHPWIGEKARRGARDAAPWKRSGINISIVCPSSSSRA